MLDEVLGPLPVHAAAHGFVPGRSVHTFAALHPGQAALVRLDLRAFFTSITAGRIYGLFRTAGYPEPVAHTLTALCTTRTPHAVSGRIEHRTPHLPQGAPTSPALANLVAFRLDRRLTGLAAASAPPTAATRTTWRSPGRCAFRPPDRGSSARSLPTRGSG